ncbi:AraC family transcriptional regulator [Bifidobacterium sp. SO4]|uniref:AraC family transcriptional regulator n=1 Tax=Bifidobacterium sp. SO4 TaxID=2809030 RepID=UPI001BDC0CA8|nr:helix-turn-helix transcriptional regulator [Bifidobacterium sp. SO4]
MTVTIARLSGPVDFFSIGQFVSGPGWRHMRRTIDTYELVVVRRGVLPMRVGDRYIRVNAGRIALLPPDVEHEGSAIITDNIEFHWMHFLLPDAHVVSDDDMPQDSRYLVLPDVRAAADLDRLTVMCDQLSDVYARFGPYSNAYCDYLATSLLLEVSAQERLKSDFRGYRTITGYAADRLVITGKDRARQEQRRVVHQAETSSLNAGLEPMLAIRSWILANACDRITVAGIAKRFHYSPSYLTAMYRRVFGVTVTEQITEYRIDRARELLSATTSSIADIACESGYDDPKYFMRVFKRRTGLTPKQYREAFPVRLYNSL